jgi:hypothetical protein
MRKTVEEICNSIINNRDDKLPKFKSTSQGLSSCLNCNNLKNPYILYDNEGLYDRLERIITHKLALAIDNNSVADVKKIKEEFGHLKEFANAKKFLNQRSKEVWNVYANPKDVPLDAMKVLGISNCPDLDSLLYNCIKYFEKDGKTTTVAAISSILKNKNIPYNMDDIYKYLESMHKNKAVKYNSNTIRYLIYEHHYDRDKLKILGAEKETINEALKTLPLKIRLKFLLKR